MFLIKMKNIIRDIIPDHGYEFFFYPDAGSGSRVKKALDMVDMDP